jgi:hypothetical protein
MHRVSVFQLCCHLQCLPVLPLEFAFLEFVQYYQPIASTSAICKHLIGFPAF